MTAVMAEQKPARPMTFEEAAKLHPGEIVDGVWVPSTPGTWSHGEVVVAIAAILGLYAKHHPGWSVAMGKPGVKLGRNPDRLRGPDVGMVRKDRIPRGKGVAGWLEGAPDLAVEVIGDSQTFSEMTKKALEYLAGGAKMVWIVDADPRRVVIFSPPDRVRILGEDDVIEGGDVLPGFRCRVAELFE